MKRILNMIAASCMVISLAGCGSDSAKDNRKQETESTVSIVTTIFPLYDWCRVVLGENPGNARLTFLLDSGTDLHSYQPSAGDMVTVSECDLFVYIGGGSDVWVPDALGNSVNPEQVSLNMMEVLKDSVREEEIIEGMEAEEEEEAEYDEHVWLSLKNAKTAVQAIASVMKEKDPVNADVYSANADGYCMYLDELDGKYSNAVDHAEFDTLVFADRFPFRYLVDDYGINYYAAFAGCSAETEASFETIRFLAEKVDELGLPGVMTIEKNDEKIARTVIRSTSKKTGTIYHLDSMQSVTEAEAEAGVTYLSVMKKNLAVLEEALGSE